MEQLLYGFIGAAVATGGTLLVKGAMKFVKSRVRFGGPDARLLQELEDRVDAHARLSSILLKLQRPQLDALIALLEATKGNANGNVDRALCSMREARVSFDEYLVGEATIDACHDFAKD